MGGIWPKLPDSVKWGPVVLQQAVDHNQINRWDLPADMRDQVLPKR